jgi:hypothetical protein
MKDQLTLSTILTKDLQDVIKRKTSKNVTEGQLWGIVDSITEQITDNLEDFIDVAIQREGIEE